MTRIKIDLPKRFVFKTEMQVSIGEINYGGHMGNDAYLRVAHEARIQFLNSQGWTEQSVEGLGLIMADAGIQFMAEVFRADQLIIEIAIADITRRGFDLYYRISNKETKALVAGLKTGMCFFDYQQKKIVSASESLMNCLIELGK